MQISPEQSDLLSAFETGRVEGIALAAPRIDTHISHVFLTATRAYKLKRAVALPFVDFSTRDRRHAACLAELEVNRRFAGAMYLGVRAVMKQPGGTYRLDGEEGELSDWLVEMKRFDDGHQFDTLAAAGKLTPDLIDDTADMIARAHAGCPPVPTSGHTADYRAILRELRKTETHGARELGLLPGEPDILQVLDRELAHIDPLVEARRRAGKVRRTHGDLHLRNICLFEGRPTPFDALEFDERLATTDVLYDLAFLLMDLVRIDSGANANRLMNRYWDMAGEAEAALELLPFFMALRAGVRMAVGIEAGAVVEADRYRQLARHLARRAPPVALALGGLSGSGKSTIARLVAPQLPGPAGARLLRSDVLRKRLQGLAPETRLTGAPAYSAAARGAVYAHLADHAREAYAAGGSVILDATFQDGAARTALEAAGLPLAKLWLDVPRDVRLARVAARPAGASDAGPDVAGAQEEPAGLGADWQRVDASGTPGDVARRVLEAIGR